MSTARFPPQVATGDDLPVAPDDVWVVPGEGMRDGAGKRGDLLIRFVVEFPTRLPASGGDAGETPRARLAAIIGGDASAPAAPSRGLFGGLFGSGGGSAAEGAAVASRAPKRRVDDLYRKRRQAK